MSKFERMKKLALEGNVEAQEYIGDYYSDEFNDKEL